MPLDSTSLKGRSIGPFARQVRALFDQIMGTPAAANVNYLQISGAAAGSDPAITAMGTDAAIDIPLVPKGAGYVQFGTLTANADAPATGYITIKDAGGTLRKLMVMT
jgi:hypothetical protein